MDAAIKKSVESEEHIALAAEKLRSGETCQGHKKHQMERGVGKDERSVS